MSRTLMVVAQPGSESARLNLTLIVRDSAPGRVFPLSSATTIVISRACLHLSLQ